MLFKCGDVVLAAELCEDVWTPVPPSCASALAGANVIVNLSASNEVTGKHAYLCDLIKQQSARCIAAYIYSSAGNGESSTDLVFAGNAMIVENGIMLGHGNRFSIEPSMVMADVDVESIKNDRRGSTSFTDSMRNNKAELDYRTIDFHFSNLDLHLPLLRKLNQFPFVPTDDSALDSRCEEIIDMQTWGLMRRLDAIGCKHVVIGVSGGARAVGNALHTNTNGDIVPCHRVVAANGRLAPNYAFGGSGEQARRLTAEGVEVWAGKVDLAKFRARLEN